MAPNNPVLAPRPTGPDKTSDSPDRRKQNTLAQRARREREDGYIFELEQKSGKVMEQFEAATETYRQNQQRLEDTVRRLHLANSVLQRERDLLQEVVNTYERVLESTGHRFLLIKVKEQLQGNYLRRQQDEQEQETKQQQKQQQTLSNPESGPSLDQIELDTSVSHLALSPPLLGGDVPEDNYEQRIFEELQSSLFPPGALQSLQIDMSNLQEVLNDHSLFDPKSPSPMPTLSPLDGSHGDDEDGEGEEGAGRDEVEKEGNESDPSELAARLATMPWDELEKMSVEFPEEPVHYVASLVRLTVDEFKTHRLYRELMLAGLQQPKTIPGVHPALFEVPQDPRIRAAPCAYLRARMILHRSKYDLDEVVRLLINTSVVYGDPRHGNNWAISEEFVERFPYLTGPEARIVLPKDKVDPGGL
ncbi:hypothetical protein CPB97_008274 [Podila verticillata]|nr:hypothetical protein CPB97_008274 [Podila verticillata]